MKLADLFDYGFKQYQLHGKGIVVNPISKPLKYIPASSSLLSNLDELVINDYDPSYQIAISEPIDPSNLKGLWKTGILTRKAENFTFEPAI